MPHSSFKFKPLGPRATQIPRRNYNAMGQIAQRVSRIGIDGYSAEDMEAPFRPSRNPERLVEVLDAVTMEAVVMYRNTTGGWVPADDHKLTLTPCDHRQIYPKRTRVWAKWHKQSGLWTPLRVPVVRFELKETLVRGKGATAYLLEQFGYGPGLNTDVTFEVRDAIDMLSGEEGDRGYAHWADDAHIYDVFQIQRHAGLHDGP
jgi:hypothetical protein